MRRQKGKMDILIGEGGQTDGRANRLLHTLVQPTLSANNDIHA